MGVPKSKEEVVAKYLINIANDGEASEYEFSLEQAKFIADIMADAFEFGYETAKKGDVMPWVKEKKY
jgi:hypothetical protein